MSREQTVRDVAFAIWQAEGKPDGRDVEHWQLAEARVASSAPSIPAKQTAKKAASGKAVAVSKDIKAIKPVSKAAVSSQVPGNSIPAKAPLKKKT